MNNLKNKTQEKFLKNENKFSLKVCTLETFLLKMAIRAKLK